jgi:hypothetical protein
MEASAICTDSPDATDIVVSGTDSPSLLFAVGSHNVLNV